MRVPTCRSLWIHAALALCVGCGNGGSTTVRLPPEPSLPHSSIFPSATAVGDDDLSPRLLRRFKPLAAPGTAGPQELVDLGRMLYFDPLLSSDRSISCNSCHPLDRYGATHTAVSYGVGGKHGLRNAPSTYNAAGQFRQFWDGNGQSSEEAVTGPLQNPVVMAMDEATLVRRLSEIEGYRRAFAAAFPASHSPISLEHVAEAIAEFERGLLTPARWDRYLAGDSAALTSQEKVGAKTFANLGCMVCHEGQFIGGSMFEKVGAVVPWPEQADRGRRNRSHDAADDMVFKVPSLRNVTQTAPYFHDGSVARLEDAVRMMARHQLGVTLTDDEVAAIVSWLGSLTGTIPEAYVHPPLLPTANPQ